MRNFQILAAAAITLVTVSACATTSPQAASAETAGEREIADYVRTHWDGFSPRAAYVAGREGEPSTLVSVESVDCGPSEGHIICTFSPKVRFADGKVSSTPLEGHFRREPDGRLQELIRIRRAPA